MKPLEQEMRFDPRAVQPAHVHADFQVVYTDFLFILGHVVDLPAVVRLFPAPAACGVIGRDSSQFTRLVPRIVLPARRHLRVVAQFRDLLPQKPLSD
jgi:hypothetical protein